MAFISVTRLKLRSVRYAPAFLVDARRTRRQVAEADGFRRGSLLMDRRWTFWTLTAWESEADMRRYMLAGPHLAAMRKLPRWCDEASVVHWQQEADALPGWREVDRRMRAEGRPSRVDAPSRHHADLSYAAPRTAFAGPIVRRAG